VRKSESRENEGCQEVASSEESWRRLRDVEASVRLRVERREGRSAPHDLVRGLAH
jgi:hypothetical protein